MDPTFDGWPVHAPALLARLAADNTEAYWVANGPQHEADVRGPTRALAKALEPEFGPVRVLRPRVNRRFRPDAPPYRVDTGGVARSAGGCSLAVVLSAASLSVSAGHRSFDAGQRRRFREAVAGGTGEKLATALGALPGWEIDGTPGLISNPPGVDADHPRIGLLRRRGLQVGRSWEPGPWLRSAEPLERVRRAWRAAAPVVAWLDEFVGPADPVPPRPRRPDGG